MEALSYAQAYQVLWLQLVDEGRMDALFGEGATRARTAPLPFMVGKKFPSVYMEFPLIGEPFLDVTVLLNEIEHGTRIDSEAAAGTEAMLDWYAGARAEDENICCGYELDTHEPELPCAAVHFQPRTHIELVEPFCQAVGEPDKARLYLDLYARMPEGWKPSFFGMFRGRPGSPLRVCGYLSESEVEACAQDGAHLASVFDEIGFSAYDDAMLAQASKLMALASQDCDFQVDIYPDGSLGDIFAIDLQFHIDRPEVVRSSFESGLAHDVFSLLETWGAADSRWKLAADAAFARAIPMERDDGTPGRFSFTLIPQWAKARWRNGVLQPSKLYYLASAGFLED